MAEKTIKTKTTSTFTIPEEQNEDWHDDIDVDYATYGNEDQEKEYISPTEVSKENIQKIKSLEEKLKLSSIKLFSMDSKLAS